MMLAPRRTLHNPPLTLPAKRTTVLRPPFPIPVSASAPRRIHLCSQTRSSLLPDTPESAPRRVRICRQTHSHTGRYSPSGIGEVLAGIGRASSRGPSRPLPCVLPERCIASIFRNACGYTDGPDFVLQNVNLTFKGGQWPPLNLILTYFFIWMMRQRHTNFHLFPDVVCSLYLSSVATASSRPRSRYRLLGSILR